MKTPDLRRWGNGVEVVWEGGWLGWGGGEG